MESSTDFSFMLAYPLSFNFLSNKSVSIEDLEEENTVIELVIIYPYFGESIEPIITPRGSDDFRPLPASSKGIL